MKRRNKIYTGAAVAALLMGTAVAVPQTIIPQAAITASAAETTRETIDKVEYEFDLSAKTATITELDYDCESFTTPEKVRYNGVDYDVTAVAGHSLIKRPKLKELTITSNIKSLGQMFCGNCFALEKVTINGTPKIESDAFYGCKALNDVTLDDSMTELGEFMFGGCESLQTIKLPSKLTNIGNCAFKNCKSLISITIPNSVETIGIEAFSHCTALEYIKMPDKLKTIEENAFWNCKKLSSITLNNELQSIGEEAFKGCELLELPVFPSSLTSLGDLAFEGATSMTGKFVIPKTLNTIGKDCFRGTGLSEVQALGSLTIKEGAFQESKNLTQVTLTGEEVLERYAFGNCESLSNVEVPISADLNWAHDVFNECPKLLHINGDSLTSSYIDKYNAVFDDSKYDAFVRKYFNASTDVGFVNEFVNTYCSGLVNDLTDDGMSQLQKAKVLHDWVIKKVDYDYADMDAPKNHCECSIFLNDKTVCEGYARGYAKLMESADIETAYESNIKHAWNICKIGDIYLHVDCCWDDQGKNYYTGEDCAPSYKWFMLSAKEFLEQEADSHSGADRMQPFSEISMGDLNMDKVIDEADIELLKTELENKKNSNPGILNDTQLLLADLDFSGTINDNDCDLLTKKYNKRFDLNGDKLNNNNDFALLQCVLTNKKTLSMEKTYQADNNNDGVVDAKDAEEMINYLTKRYGNYTYYRMGDLNLDGTVDKNDLLALQNYGNKHISFEADYKLADLNFDGIVDELDYRALKALTKYQLGDVDFSGTVDSTDRDLIMKHLTISWEHLPNDACWYADINGDGAIDTNDIDQLCRDYSILNYQLGDVDFNGTVDSTDRDHIMMHLTTNWGRLPSEALQYADVNGDDAIDVMDIKKLCVDYNIPDYQLGDVDFNGTVDKADKDIIMKHIINVELLPDAAFSYADVTRDGCIDVADVIQLCRDYNITD